MEGLFGYNNGDQERGERGNPITPSWLCEGLDGPECVLPVRSDFFYSLLPTPTPELLQSGGKVIWITGNVY